MGKGYAVRSTLIVPEFNLDYTRVNCTLYDSYGFTWVATNDRLQRYDGFGLETILHFPPQISDQHQLSLREGPKGSIYLARRTADAHTAYSAASKTLTEILLDRNTLEPTSWETIYRNHPPPVPLDDLASLFCSPNGKLCYFGLRNGSWLRSDGNTWIRSQQSDRPERGVLQHVVFDEDGRSWIFYPFNAYVYSPSGELLETLPAAASTENAVTRKASDEELSTSPNLTGLSTDDTARKAKAYVERKTGGGPRPVRGRDGFAFVNDSGTPAILAPNGDTALKAASGADFNYVSTDAHGRFRYETADGISLLSVAEVPFRSILDDLPFKVSCRGMAVIRDTVLAVNTYAGTFLAPYGSIQRGQPAFERPLPKFAGLGIAVSPEGNAAVGKHAAALTWIDRKLDVTREDISFLYPKSIYSHQPYFTSDSTLWVANSAGLAHQERSGAWSSILDLPAEKPSAYYLEEFDDGLWVSSDRGLLRIDPTARRLIDSFPVLEEFRVFHFARVRDTFYLATDKGLVVWNRNRDAFNRIQLQDEGFPQSMHCVYNDGFGHLWLTSNHGLFKYGLASGQINKYVTTDGLPNNEFNRFSHFRGPDGRLFFGTIDGMIEFLPEEFRDVAAQGHSVRLQLDPISTYSLKKAKWESAEFRGGRIVLRPANVTLRVPVSLPGNLHGAATQVQYRVVELGEEWTAADGAEVRINRPPPGDYTMQIRALYPDGDTAGPALKVGFAVLAPFYARSWFVIGSILFFTMLTGILFHWRQRRLIEQAGRLEAGIKRATTQIEKDAARLGSQNDQLQALNRQKEQLLNIIAHDLKGPILSLKGVGNTVARLSRTNQTAQLDQLGRDIDLLVTRCFLTLDNLLLSAGQQHLVDTLEIVDLADACRQQIDLLRSAALFRSVQLSLDVNQGNTRINGILFGVASLIRNLVMNAVNHSPVGATVTVGVRDLGNSVELSVEDKGTGMKPEQARALTSLVSDPGKWKPDATSTKLGWRVVANMVALHQAAVSITSTPRYGTIVIVSFPILEGQPLEGAVLSLN